MAEKPKFVIIPWDLGIYKRISHSTPKTAIRKCLNHKRKSTVLLLGLATCLEFGMKHVLESSVQGKAPFPIPTFLNTVFKENCTLLLSDDCVGDFISMIISILLPSRLVAIWGSPAFPVAEDPKVLFLVSQKTQFRSH